ncbi:MAG: ATP-binding protein [candidate division Zixibacteria bacterium]|nr:ATP-binding protein [candidate division Zixibacteria bacterium]MBU1469914.1 ATP-binding protein [candidate division Zixibacteria bacterium]
MNLTWGTSADYYRDLRRKTILRLSAIYLSPVILLTAYFVLQYGAFISETERLHLRAIAESQANTLDLFMTERRVNLSNVIDNPKFPIPPTSSNMQDYLTELRRISEAFVDIGFFDSSGVQVAYSGPFPSLEKKSYSGEKWYSDLTKGESSTIVTDIYLGFRQKPHFTIAVSRVTYSGVVVLRATLDPERLYEYISSLNGAQEVVTSILNHLGDFQLVASSVGRPLEASPVLPPQDPRQGAEQTRINGSLSVYGYSWLRTVDWVLIVQQSAAKQSGLLSGFRFRVISVAAVLVLAGFFVIVNRSRKRVELQRDSDSSRAQLSHAAKLASVGELAAGIAHEINNPLASINEEAGLMKDLMDPSLGEPVKPEELKHYLDSIQESVFRCRDITRKLLGFVRKTDIELRHQNVHRLIDEVVDGLLGHELSVSNIKIVRTYATDIPELLTDGNQLEQVILNILNNAIDAMEDNPGTIRIKTKRAGNYVMIAISDTGKGMTLAQLENIFMPFFTTKAVGKGTGLGLSVSYGIVRNLGGKITVESEPGKGSEFTAVIPLDSKSNGH